MIDVAEATRVPKPQLNRRVYRFWPGIIDVTPSYVTLGQAPQYEGKPQGIDPAEALKIRRSSFIEPGSTDPVAVARYEDAQTFGI